jgi:sialic acid synthase SpsE
MSVPFHIGHKGIGGDHPVFIIAEIGINHGGNENTCAEMIDAAAAGGADAVKLQTVTPEESYHPATESFAVFRQASLPAAALRRLIGRADDRGVVCFSTPGDFRALDLVLAVGIPAIKISSGLLTNFPLIRRAARTGLPLIFSTGMAYLEEVVKAIELARAEGAGGIAVLQCTSLYPAPAATLNLAAIDQLARATGAVVGYSDHHDGDLACIAAVARGAKVIEKHFTLDRTRAGADHRISLQPEEFGRMVGAIREVERMLGDGVKQPHPDEIPLRAARHRMIVAKFPIARGERIREASVLLMRMPAGAAGLDPGWYDRIIDRAAVRPIPALAPITLADVGEKQ